MSHRRVLSWWFICGLASTCAAGPLWTTNVGWTGVWSREPGAARCILDSSSTVVIHTGLLDWALEPQVSVPAPPGHVVEISAPASHSGTGDVGLAFAVRGEDGKIREWTRSYRSTGGRATSVVLRTRTVVESGEHLVARVIGHGPGTARVGTLQVRVMENLTLQLPEQLELSSKDWTLQFQPRTAIVSLKDHRNGRVWTTLPTRMSDWHVVSARARTNRLEWVVQRVEDDLEVRVSVEQVPGAPHELLWRLDEVAPSGPGLDPTALAWTTPIMVPSPWESPPGSEIILPLNEGIGFPVKDPNCPPMELAAFQGHGGICMAFWGLVVGESGIMALLETPDDAGVRTLRTPSGTLVIGPQWYPQWRRWGYQRRMRWILFDQGGYVAMCRRYRQHARAMGQFVTLREKARRNPNVHRLAGAANVWFMDHRHDPVAMARELRQSGWERVLWSRGGSSNVVAEINQLGFLTSRYDIYQDCMDPAQFPNLKGRHPDWTSEAWPTGIVRRADGNWERGWRVEAKDGSMIPCGVLCDRLAPDWARRRIRADLAEHPYRARFIDTTTASPWRECYDPAHPMTRSESRKFRMELLAVVSQEFNLVCGSETGHDAAVPFVHYFEGMLSLAPFRVPDAGRNIMQKWTNVPDPVARFQLGPRYRLPLWELVYHDCVVAQWYWGDYNNKLPALWRHRDLWNALYGTPPMYMFDRAEWERDRDRFCQSYRTATPVAARTMWVPMVHHARLTPDGTIQQSEFENGTVVVVNFGATPFTLPDGRTVPPEDALVTWGTGSTRP